MKLVIGHLYPDLLNLYGDRGNIQCMMKRSQWRGIEAETIECSPPGPYRPGGINKQIKSIESKLQGAKRWGPL